MDKTSEKVKKDPKRVEVARKSREKYMNKLKESILNDAEKGRDTANTSNEPTSATNTATTPATTTRSNDTYGIGILAVLAIGVCVSFAYNTFPKNKKTVNEKQDQQPKRSPML